MAEEGCTCKVGRAADRYELPELDVELKRRHENGDSLRTLANVVNKRILRAAIEREGGDVSTLVASERGVDALYEVLDGDGSSTERARVRTRLEQAGVDVESVTNDWVSHATIKNHLNDCLAVDTSREPSITREDAINTVEWTRSRSENVVAETVRRLESADLVDISNPTATVTVRITCEDCGRSYSVQSLLEEGRCACFDETSPTRSGRH